MSHKFTESEMSALSVLSQQRSILISQIPDKNINDHLDGLTAGMTTYKKLIKKGLCFITEEDPILFDGDDEEFYFTPSIELTEEGESLIKTLSF